MKFLSATLTMLAVLACSVGASAQDEKSSAQLRALSDRQAERQAKRDLNSLLDDFSGYRIGSRLSLGDVWFFTKPRSSHAWGVCEKDIVSLYYRTIEREPRDYARAPVKPHKIKARTMYSFLGNPTLQELRRDFVDGKPSPTTMRECKSGTEDGWHGWFYAESEFKAVSGFKALHIAKEALEAGLVELDECGETDSEKERCRQTFYGAINPMRLSSIEAKNVGYEPSKWFIDSNMAHIIIEFDQQLADPKPENVKSISVSEYIIVT